MPRVSDSTKKILAKIDDMTDWIKDIDEQQRELTVDRERAIERIKEYRDFLPKPKKKAAKKAKESKPVHQCPNCGEITDQDKCPKCTVKEEYTK